MTDHEREAMNKLSKKPRKPENSWVGEAKLQVLDNTVALGWDKLCAEECRKAAAWLLKAADYLDAQKPKGKP